jgi:hypothetical protein
MCKLAFDFNPALPDRRRLWRGHFVVETGAAGVEQAECPKRFGLWVTALPDGRVMTWWPEEKPGAADATGTVQ